VSSEGKEWFQYLSPELSFAELEGERHVLEKKSSITKLTIFIFSKEMCSLYLKFYEDCPKKIRKKLGFEIRDDELKQIQQKPQLTGPILIKSNEYNQINHELASSNKPKGLSSNGNDNRKSDSLNTTPTTPTASSMISKVVQNEPKTPVNQQIQKPVFTSAPSTTAGLIQAKSYKEHLEMKKQLQQQQLNQTSNAPDESKNKKPQATNLSLAQHNFKIKAPDLASDALLKTKSLKHKHSNGHSDESGLSIKKLQLSLSQASTR
jgi:hypothetical protein